VSEALVLASGAKTAVAEYASVKGEFPASNGDAGLEDKGTIKGKYVASVEVGADGVITATFGDDAHTELKDHELFLTPGGLDSGSITWACTGKEDIKAYLPSGCEVADSGPKDGDAWDSLTNDEDRATASACYNTASDRWEVGLNGCEGPDAADVSVYAEFCKGEARDWANIGCDLVCQGSMGLEKECQ
jgi:type IV pilus assembly protein PilA